MGQGSQRPDRQWAEVTNLITTFKGNDGKMYSRTTMTEVKIIEHIPVEEKEHSNEMGW
jgi:hypothetical protein